MASNTKATSVKRKNKHEKAGRRRKNKLAKKSTPSTTELFARPLRTDPLRWTGNVPLRAGRVLEDAGYDLHAMLDTAGSK